MATSALTTRVNEYDTPTGVPLTQREFDSVRKRIYDIAGISLSDAKQVLVQSRLAKRLRFYNLNSHTDYLNLLDDPVTGAEETERFVNCLTTNKTEFFRESHHFDFLRERVYPEIVERSKCGGPRKVRIWCCASSTGEEPYTLSMSLREYFSNLLDWDLRILASDIDTDVLRKASEGKYTQDAMDYLAPAYAKKYFKQKDGIYTVKPELQALITFRQLNLIESTWNINTKFDAIFCRNVMIYFNAETQRRLIENLTRFLTPNGYLIIGHSESLLNFNERLESLGNTIYRIKSNAESTKTPLETTVRVKTNGDCAVKTKCNPSSVDVPLATPRVSEQVADLLPKRSIIVGQYFASEKPCSISTTLGSCIAACLFDPKSKIGGMNHFMLPESKLEDFQCASYGIHAMELLINAIMKLGADRRKIRAKIFGGASMVNSNSEIWSVGQLNIDFVRQFLETERIPIDAELVGGECGSHVTMHTHTAKVFVRLLDRHATQRLVREHIQDSARLVRQYALPAQDQVTLFS